MNQEKTVQSREMWSCCCGARSWALVIGWIQVIFSAMAGIAIYTIFILEMGNPQPIGDFHNTLLAILIAVYVGLATLFAAGAGIVLVVGVKQANAEKLKIWIVIQIIFLVLNILTLNLVTIAIARFSLWVVHVHRQEIIIKVSSSDNDNYDYH